MVYNQLSKLNQANKENSYLTLYRLELYGTRTDIITLKQLHLGRYRTVANFISVDYLFRLLNLNNSCYIVNLSVLKKRPRVLNTISLDAKLMSDINITLRKSCSSNCVLEIRRVQDLPNFLTKSVLFNTVLFNYYDICAIVKRDNTISLISECKLKLLKDNATFNFSKLDGLKKLYINNLDITFLSDLNGWFSNNTIEKIVLDHFDMTNIVSVKYMFYNCYNLESISIKNAKCSALKQTYCLFGNCKKLKSVDFMHVLDINSNPTLFYDSPFMMKKQE